MVQIKRDWFDTALKNYERGEKEQIQAVVEGSNMDDNGDYRPGLIAIDELGIKSPLRHAEMTKNDIRERSKALGLKTWDKQSFACLSSSSLPHPLHPYG